MILNLPKVPLATVQIATSSGPVPITIHTGEAFMVAGPNGVGKSALLYTIYRMIGSGRAEYYPGHRQITFNSGWDNLGQDVDQLRTNLYTQIDIFNRYKNHWAEDMFKSVVRRLANMDASHNSQISSLLGQSVEAALTFKASKPGPVAILNNVFSTARMAVRFVSSGRGLRAQRDGMEYDIDQLSDGERAALLIAGAVIVQDPFTVISIDEPERNLHPSIASPLVNALMLARPDVAFLLASHDMSLISGVEVDSIIYIKNSQVISTRPETRVFDVRLLSGLESVDEELRRDLIGARQDILFIEGGYTSIDFQIYNSLFKSWKIAPKGGADRVSEAVKALADNPSLHWFKVAGLIDRDGRDDSEIDKLKKSHVNALLCPTAENLLFLPEVASAVADTLNETEGGLSRVQRIANVEAALPEMLAQAEEEIIARATAWRINRILAEQKVSVAQVRDGSAIIAPIDAKKLHAEVGNDIKSALKKCKAIKEIASIPIKNTPIPSSICAIIGCNYDRYRKIVFRQLEADTPRAAQIRSAMLSQIPDLAIQQPA